MREHEPQPARTSLFAAIGRQTRQNPVIWVLFAFMILLLVPIQVFTPLKPPYTEADTWAQIIATLMVALAFDASLNTSWLMPTRNRQEAIDRKERIGAFTMLLLVLIAAGLLVTMYMTGWRTEDEPVPEFISFLPVAAVGAELFLLMVSFYLRTSDPTREE